MSVNYRERNLHKETSMNTYHFFCESVGGFYSVKGNRSHLSLEISSLSSHTIRSTITYSSKTIKFATKTQINVIVVIFQNTKIKVIKKFNFNGNAKSKHSLLIRSM